MKCNVVGLLPRILITVMLVPYVSNQESKNPVCVPGSYSIPGRNGMCDVAPPEGYFFSLEYGRYQKCLDCWSHHRQLLNPCTKYRNTECAECHHGYTEVYNNMFFSMECVKELEFEQPVRDSIKISKPEQHPDEGKPKLPPDKLTDPPTPAENVHATETDCQACTKDTTDWRLMAYILLTVLCFFSLIIITLLVLYIRLKKSHHRHYRPTTSSDTGSQWTIYNQVLNRNTNSS